MKLHIVKRDNCPLWKAILFYAVAVVTALGIGAVALLIMGVNPFSYYKEVFTMGTLDNRYPETIWVNYLEVLVPLVLVSLGLSLAFKMRFWNIGGEGQFILGSVAAATVAFKLGPILPGALTLVLMCAVAMAAAGLYGLVVAVLKVKFGTNETLLTLMLNYIALYFLIFLSEAKQGWNFFLQKDSPRPVFETFEDIAAFPSIPITPRFGLNICVIFIVLIAVMVFVYLKYTKQGYEIAVVGDSPNTAKYAGMKVNRIVLRTVFLSAALIGLAAAFKVGTSGELSTTITDDVGWTGVIVAWLAKLNTVGIFAVSALICLLQRGCEIANASFRQVDANFADMLQGIILFLVLAADFCTRFRVVISKKGGK